MEREWSRTAPRAQLSTFNWNQNNYPGNSRTQLTPHPIRTTNRYSILAEQHDPAVEHELIHVIEKEHETDSPPTTPIKENSLKTK